MSMTNDMVAHLWANQSRPHARSSNGNLWFEGRTLYSYRTPIGHIMVTDSRATLILTSNYSYSITTTSNHYRARYRALAVRAGVVSVDRLEELPLRSGTNEAIATEAIKRLEREFDLGVEKAKKSTRHTLGYLTERCRHVVRDARTILNAFPEGIIPARDLNKELQDILRQPDIVARIEKQTAANEERRQRSEERIRRARSEQMVRNRAKMEDWLAGKNVHPMDDGSGVRLRVRGFNLETSLGATVPLEDATLIFRLAMVCRERNEARLPSLKRQKIGEFTLDRILADGTIIAGCHTIAYAEAERIARQIGLIKDEHTPSTEQAA